MFTFFLPSIEFVLYMSLLGGMLRLLFFPYYHFTNLFSLFKCLFIFLLVHLTFKQLPYLSYIED